MIMYELHATDCDGPGVIQWAPLFESEEAAFAFFEEIADTELSRPWVREVYVSGADND